MSAIDEIIEREGGFVDNPADRGGPTNMGITLPVLSKWLGRVATIDELKALDRATAFAIYDKMFLRDTGIVKIADEGLRGLVLDAAVNHGPRRAVVILQQALGVTADGILGPATLSALATTPQVSVHFLARRLQFFAKLLANASQLQFAAGWMNRVASQLLEVAS